MHLAPRERHSRTDATLEGGAAESAFAALYEQHFDGLFDFVVRIVGDRDMAGEVVQATFARAWDEIRERPAIRHPKAWLYTVARNRAIDELRGRRRIVAELPEYAEADSSRLADPHAVAEQHEIADLVWESATSLSSEEYSLLDMHVRHGLGAAELADELELERGAVYTRLSRLRNSLEEAVGSMLLVRTGSQDCFELAQIVAEHGGSESLTPQLRRAVRQHVKDCEACREARRRLVSPVELFGALTPVAALPGVRDGIWQSVGPAATQAAGAAGAGVGVAASGARKAGSAAQWAAGSAVVATAAAVLAIVLGGGPSVADPERVVSPDHDVGVASTDRTVTVRWPPGKNASGYSVVFSRDRSFEPPAVVNVRGTSFTSAALAPGRWWFILRTRGRDGDWTATLRAGPFVIVEAPEPIAERPAAKQRKRRAPRRAAAAQPPALALAPAATGVPAPGPRPVASPRAAPREVPRKKAAPPRTRKPRRPPPTRTPSAPQEPAAGQQPVAEQPPAGAQPPEAVATPEPVKPPEGGPPPGGGDDDEGDDEDRDDDDDGDGDGGRPRGHTHDHHHGHRGHGNGHNHA